MNLFAQRAYEEDRDFWKEAAAASRAYLHSACHEKTGLSAEYADYDGKPHTGHKGNNLEDMTGITVMHTARSPI